MSNQQSSIGCNGVLHRVRWTFFLLPKDAKPVNGDNSLWTNFRSKLTNAPAIAGLSLGRALGAPLAPLLYGFGFLAVAAGNGAFASMTSGGVAFASITATHSMSRLPIITEKRLL